MGEENKYCIQVEDVSNLKKKKGHNILLAFPSRNGLYCSALEGGLAFSLALTCGKQQK